MLMKISFTYADYLTFLRKVAYFSKLYNILKLHEGFVCHFYVSTCLKWSSYGTLFQEGIKIGDVWFLEEVHLGEGHVDIDELFC